MIVEVEVIEPDFHILAGLAQVADALGEKLQRFHVVLTDEFEDRYPKDIIDQLAVDLTSDCIEWVRRADYSISSTV